MTITTKVTIHSLSETSVSLLRQKFVEDEQLGRDNITIFENSEKGRKEVSRYLEKQPDFLTAVFAVWGKEALVVEELPQAKSDYTPCLS